MLDKEPNEVLVHTGGGNSDHKNSATKEIDETFLMIMEKLEREAFAQGPFRGNKVYGVPRRAIRNEDWFHSVNLAVMFASLGAFGPTIKDNTQNQHKQVHYWQAIQLFADIMKHCDGQAHMDFVMKDSSHEVTVRRVRERQQRWLVNQESATWIIMHAVRKRKADRALLDTNNPSKRKKRSGGIKHDRTKDLQIFQANQLLELGQRYKTKVIQQLPERILSRAGVRQFKVMGCVHKDKEMKVRRMMRLEEKKSNYRREVLTLDQYKEMAEELTLNYDTNFKIT